MENLKQAFNYFIVATNTSISKVCRKFKITTEEFISYLVSNKYFLASSGKRRLSIISYHDAAEEYASSDYWNISVVSIAKKYNIGSGRLSNYINTYYPELTVLDDTVFDSIDTEEKAYWLGFIFADGYISSSPLDNNLITLYSIEISLKLDDIEHLKKAKEFFLYKRVVHEDSYRCRLVFNSKHLWNTLNNLGCTPRKSLTLKFPNKTMFKSQDLIRHFIRGYFDGDGCLTYKRANYPTISVLGTEDFLKGMLSELQTSKTLYNNNNLDDCLTKVLKYNGLEAYNICNYMYRNCSIALKRKYEKYLEYCRLYEESYRGSESKNGEG